MEGNGEDIQHLLEKGRPWYLNGYTEVLVFAMIPLVLVLSAFLK